MTVADKKEVKAAYKVDEAAKAKEDKLASVSKWKQDLEDVLKANKENREWRP